MQTMLLLLLLLLLLLFEPHNAPAMLLLRLTLEPTAATQAQLSRPQFGAQNTLPAEQNTPRGTRRTIPFEAFPGAQITLPVEQNTPTVAQRTSPLLFFSGA